MYNNWSPYDYWADEEMKEIRIDEAMQDYREKALGKFNSMIPHPEFALSIALSVVSGYRESLTESEDIIKKLDLDQLEICAVEENFYLFKKFYLEEQDNDRINFYSGEDV
jgi:hypothetical protein